jgi:hypothetical protein
MCAPLNRYNTYSVDVTLENSQGKQIYQTQFDNPEDFDNFIRDKCRSRDDWGICKSTLIPVRTNFKDFYKDLFFPTVVNRALTIDGLVKKSFAILLSLALDLYTLPARAITVIPRALYNAFRKNHPLYEFLIQQGISKNELGDGRLILKCREEASVEGQHLDHRLRDFNAGSSATLKEARDKADQALYFFSYKYFCDPNYKRKPVKMVKGDAKGDETTKVVHTETIERDIRCKVIPDGSWYLKGSVETTIYHKNDQGNWSENSKKTYPVDFRHDQW